MGILNKIKDMFFEEDSDDVQINDNRIAKKIELPKRKKNKEEDIKKELEEKEEIEEEKEEQEPEEIKKEDFFEEEIEEELEEELTPKKKPIIFDDEDFIEDFVPEKETKEHVLYGGVQKKEVYVEKNLGLFLDLSEISYEGFSSITRVYGVLTKNYQKEDFEEHKNKKDLDHLFVDERKKKITFDSVRQKAYGDLTEEIEQTMEMKSKKDDLESTGLLYDIEDKEEKSPKIESVTMGDAEEYFKDLGLEYNVDYIDASKTHKSRSEKNKKLQDEVKEEKEIKPEKEEKEPNDVEEKNLYDLIDMMYDSNEEE